MLGKKTRNGPGASVMGIACLTAVLAAAPHDSKGASAIPGIDVSPIASAAMRGERDTVVLPLFTLIANKRHRV